VQRRQRWSVGTFEHFNILIKFILHIYTPYHVYKIYNIIGAGRIRIYRLSEVPAWSVV
jgi:hypothetical protein